MRPRWRRRRPRRGRKTCARWRRSGPFLGRPSHQVGKGAQGRRLTSQYVPRRHRLGPGWLTVQFPAAPADPQLRQHPSWPEAPPPSRYVVPPPAPGRYPADAPAPGRRRSLTGASLIVGCIVLLGIAGAVFAGLRGHSTSTPLPPSSPSAHTTSPAATTRAPVNPVPAGPAATVQAYVAAINAHDYAKAWD